MTRTHHRQQWRKITLACATAVLAVGCTGNQPASPKPPPTTPAATSTTAPEPTKTEVPVDPVEAAKKEAIATYLSHWKEVQKRYGDKTNKAGDLEKYAASAALSQVKYDTGNMRKRNTVALGTVTVGNPTATSADIDRKIPNVIISSCLDISQWQVVNADTKKPVSLPKERLLRYVMKATVEKWPEGWRVIRDEPQGKKC
ncbi:hypothetical protein ACIGHB_30030 [Streptomyces sp. NPDC085460]|uniref:hypothetical protein n=1 Tax=Streptomyces sp. NPDC085460 TaxID=3365723 RepID=UPI0037D80B4A